MVIIFLDRSLGRLRISSWQTPHNAIWDVSRTLPPQVQDRLTQKLCTWPSQSHWFIKICMFLNYTLVKSHSNSKWTLWRFLCVQVMYKLLWSFIYFYFLLKKGIWYVISMLFYLCYLFYLEATFYFGTSMTISDPPALSRWRPSWLRDAGRGQSRARTVTKAMVGKVWHLVVTAILSDLKTLKEWNIQYNNV